MVYFKDETHGIDFVFLPAPAPRGRGGGPGWGGRALGMGLPPWKGWSQTVEDRAGWDQPKRLQKANLSLLPEGFVGEDAANGRKRQPVVVDKAIRVQ